MEYQDQLTKMNKELRELAEGQTGSQLSFNTRIVQPTISNWRKGQDLNLKTLSKIAMALGRKVVIKLEQDWTEGKESKDA